VGKWEDGKEDLRFELRKTIQNPKSKIQNPQKSPQGG
jgi:hypothetical protein